LIVDDSALVVHELSRIVTEELGFEVAGAAEHGVQAVDMATAMRPDLVTLDVRMPVMNGLTALKHIMTRRPVATVMVSGATNEDSHLAFECLRCGALDFVWKPTNELDGGDRDVQRQRIRDRLRHAASVNAPLPRYCRLRRQGVSVRPSTRAPESLGVIVGGRTGLAPLMALVNSVPAGAASSWVALLDLSPRVVASFADYLSTLTALSVQLVSPGLELRAESVYLMPSSRAFTVSRNGDAARFDAVPFQDSASVVGSLVEACRGRPPFFVALSGASRSAALEAARYASSSSLAVAQSPVTALEAEGLQNVVNAPGVRAAAPYEVARVIGVELGGRLR
jgi:two-component system chemotaxis response regulator CheB